MATNRGGTILFGHSSNKPLFGSSGRVLHSLFPFKTTAVIVIDWEEDDIDICAYWVGHEGNVGWTYGTTSSSGGYRQNWKSGDRTQGGPETVTAGVDAVSFAQGDAWRVHLNWFRGGPGVCSVTINPPVGNPLEVSSVAVGSRGGPATTQDPGLEVVFNENGTISNVTRIIPN